MVWHTLLKGQGSYNIPVIVYVVVKYAFFVHFCRGLVPQVLRVTGYGPKI
jgi:hypothetical protein